MKWKHAMGDDKMGVLFLVFWVGTFLVTLGTLGLICWAIIRLVLKYT